MANIIDDKLCTNDITVFLEFLYRIDPLTMTAWDTSGIEWEMSATEALSVDGVYGVRVYSERYEIARKRLATIYGLGPCHVALLDKPIRFEIIK